MTLRGRSRSARRYQVMSDLVTPRALLVASLAAAGATGIGLALAPSGSLATPGPLSAPHTKANVACAKCHGRAESTSPTARIEELTTLSCIGCHGAHDLEATRARWSKANSAAPRAIRPTRRRRSPS